MKIEVWSDFMCPFCYLGEVKRRRAVANLGVEDKVEILFRSYELHPGGPEWDGSSFADLIMKKYGMTREEAEARNADITAHAKDLGLDYRMDLMKPTNSFKAHRLAKFGSSLGKEKEILEGLFSAYFEHGANLSDDKELLAIAVKAGLPAEETEKVLKDGTAFASEVHRDEDLSGRYSVDTVPFFLFNGKYVVTGDQSVSTFEKAIRTALDDMEK